MATGLMARIATLERKVASLEGRVGDVEDEQHAQHKRFGRVERSLRTVLTCLERLTLQQQRFHNRTAAAVDEALSAVRPRR